MDEGESDDNDSHYVSAAGVIRRGEHQRTGSGRSSAGSGRRVASYSHGRFSQGSTPPNEVGGSPMGDLAEETPVPEDYRPRQGDYFNTAAGGTGLSGGSGSSSETRENSFGGVGTMPQKTGGPDVQKTADELRRRGSVDDRTMTLSGMGVGRLVVANPDLSD